MRGVALTFLAVLVVGSAAWAIVPTGSPGFSASGVRAGVLVVLGTGVLGAALHEPARRRLALELLAIGLGGVWVLVWLGNGAAAAVALVRFLVFPGAWLGIMAFIFSVFSALTSSCFAFNIPSCLKVIILDSF